MRVPARLVQCVSIVGIMIAGSLPLAGADHPQPAAGDVVVFDHVGGNEWWVEVSLTGGASGSVAGVDAKDTEGTWKALAKSEDTWTGSFHIEPGHDVKFRATWAGGEVVKSCWFTHPAGVEDCGGSVWPREGSFVTYESFSGGGAPDGSFYQTDYATIELRFENGAWVGECFGDHFEYRDGVEETTTFSQSVDFAPVRQTEVANGVEVEMPYINACVPTFEMGIGARDYTHALRNNDRIATLRVERGTEAPGEDAYHDLHSIADQSLGLVVLWSHFRLHSHDFGQILGTDAPLGTELSAQDQEAMQGEWPVEGSEAAQFWCRMNAVGGCRPGDQTSIYFVYKDGAWSGQCFGTVGGVTVDMQVDFGPAMGTFTAPGGLTTVERLRGCSKVATQVEVFTFDIWHAMRAPTFDNPVALETWVGGSPEGVSQLRVTQVDVESGLLLHGLVGEQMTETMYADVRFV